MDRAEAIANLRAAGFDAEADALDAVPDSGAGPAESVADIIAAQAAADVQVIEAAAAADVQVIEAEAAVMELANPLPVGDPAPAVSDDPEMADIVDNGLPDGSAGPADPLPQESHWFFRTRGKK